jgi:hypothetical protein
MNKPKQWIASKGIYHYSEIPDVFKALPSYVYELQFDAFAGCFVLEKICDKFALPEVMYNLENDLIERILKTFKGYNKNFGVLLKGLKGTGKTIAAKVICNTLELPVILVTKPWNDMGNFISSIQQDIIMLFDEFEKTYNFGYYNDDDEAHAQLQANNPAIGSKDVTNLLTLMDGVFTSQYKRLFLLTTNKDYLPDPLVARPSRIRYIKEFSDLPLPVILQILEDTVTNKKLIPDLISLLKGLEILTVDIVKAIAEEANLFNTADPDFFTIFNVKRIQNHYDIYELDARGKEQVLIENMSINITDLRNGRHLYGEDQEYFATIQKCDHEAKTLIVVDQQANQGTKRAKPRLVHYRKSITPHYSFSHYSPDF